MFTKCRWIVGSSLYCCVCFAAHVIVMWERNNVYVIVLTCVGCTCVHVCACLSVHVGALVGLYKYLASPQVCRFSGELEINHPNPCWHQTPWSTNQQCSQTNVNRQRDGHYVGFNHHCWCLTSCVCLTGIWGCRGKRRRTEGIRGEKGRKIPGKAKTNCLQ